MVNSSDMNHALLIPRRRGGSAVDMFVFAGQSNAAAANGTGVPTHYGTLDQNIKIWDGDEFVTYDPPNNSDWYESQTWWGPEAEFAYQWRLANPTKTFYMVKVVQGATSLALNGGADDWSIDSTGELYDDLTGHVAAAKAAILELNPVIRALIWMQGEHDINDPDCFAYEANLTAFISAARTDLAAPTMKFVIGRLKVESGGAGVAAVKAAQLAVSQSVANAAIVSTSNLATSDGTHYTTANVAVLGGYFYQAYTGAYDGRPTAIAIAWGAAFTGGAIPKNTAVGATIGTLSATNAVVGGTVTFSETVDADSAISVSGSNLLLARNLSGEATSTTHTFTLRATNDISLTYDEAFSLSVADAVVAGAATIVLSEVDHNTTSHTLSSDLLTVTSSNATAVNGSAYLLAGKAFFSGIWDGGGTSANIGVCSTSKATLGNSPGLDADTAALWNPGWQYIENNLLSGPSYVANDVVDVAVDVDAKLIWWRKNGGNWNADAGANPAAGTGGEDISGLPDGLLPVVGISASGGSWTVNFGASPYSYAAPSGFGNWPVLTSVWNPRAKGAIVTLAGSNLVASNVTTDEANTTRIRATAYAATGRKFFSVTDDAAVTYVMIGLTNKTATFDFFQCFYWRSGGVYINGSGTPVATLATYTSGDIIDVAVNLDARLVWFRKNGGNWNGSGTANPATGVEGLDISAVTGNIYPSAILYSINSQVTANFGGSAYTHAAPSGFSNF